VQYTYFDIIHHPDKVYDQMREQGAIHWNKKYQVWLVVRHAEARDLLRDPRLSSKITGSMELTTFPVRSRGKVKPILDLFNHWLLFSDPPYHTEMRKLLMPYFTKPALDAMTPKIKAHTEELLSHCQGEWDFVEKFARQLPAKIMADLVGLPYDDMPLFCRWNSALSDFMEAVVRTPEIVDKALSALKSEEAYFLKPKSMQSDFMKQLPKEQALYVLSMLIAAGVETSQNVLANGLYRLLSQADQWELLKKQPELLMSAINECLRYDSPAQSMLRVATEEVAVGGVTIKQGEYVRIVLAAINRDPNDFENPHQFDITRDPNKHLAFGSGIHFCIGQVLARLTASIAFPAIIKKFPHLKLKTQNPEWVGGIVLRGLKELMVGV